jgi:hypothetical protein
MKKSLLVQMLELAASNHKSNRIHEFALKITVDPELLDDVTIDDFPNEFYSVREIRWITQCFNFYLR